jgi:DNA-binding Xre family transcriptional regulator
MRTHAGRDGQPQGVARQGDRALCLDAADESTPSNPLSEPALSPGVASSASGWRRGGCAREPAAHRVPSSDHALDFGDGLQIGSAGLVVVISPTRLKTTCATRGWSLTELSRRAGISYPTVRAIVSGQAVRPRTAWRLARALRAEHAYDDLAGLVQQ